MSENDYCYYCNYCNSCYSCNSCNSCYYCSYCDSCNYCDYCKNLKMTEYNLFCFSKSYNNDASFQQKRYRAFNVMVGKDRYNAIKKEVEIILKDIEQCKLTDYWKKLTQDHWNKLLAIPEASDFKDGFEYISGVKIDNKVKIIFDGKEIFISKESAAEFKKQFIA